MKRQFYAKRTLVSYKLRRVPAAFVGFVGKPFAYILSYHLSLGFYIIFLVKQSDDLGLIEDYFWFIKTPIVGIGKYKSSWHISSYDEKTLFLSDSFPWFLLR